MTGTVRPSDMPLLDLAAYAQGTAEDRGRQVARCRRALEERGFVTLVGHRVPSELVARGYEMSRRLFALPSGTKAGLDKGRGVVGYVPQGVEQALRGRRPDLKELWHHAHQPPADHPLRASEPQAYPPNRRVPDVPGFDETLDALDRAFAQCSGELLRVLSASVGMPERWLADIADGAPHMLRLVHYPPLPPTLAPGEERAVEHTGAGLLGILPPATSEGLEIRSPAGAWQRLEGFGPEHLVVTIADQIERLTAGRIPGSLHRVANPTGEAQRQDRYAIVYFVSAAPHTLLWPPAPLLAGRPRPSFEPVTSWEFMADRMTEVWLNRASAPYRFLRRLKRRIARGASG